ncbi:DgyrCDS422 [Dimorphilus gyrociliatus]|uniref:DgyrCDS422 n=1 Tax=Dimorphilus gyrociliatus TaxID=2664684 RepID=A0A7I8V4E8_9ANNE|nr:DgyrCDS422 [Dimorphilus gyrociliatus]
MDEMIAADLTLYTNPLNSALADIGIKKPDKNDEKENEKTDIVAADLTQYDSPLADIEKGFKRNDKQEKVDETPKETINETEQEELNPTTKSTPNLRLTPNKGSNPKLRRQSEGTKVKKVRK